MRKTRITPPKRRETRNRHQTALRKATPWVAFVLLVLQLLRQLVELGVRL